MPPVYRRLFTFCSALSLLLCVATSALWIWAAWGFPPHYRMVRAGTLYDVGIQHEFHVRTLDGWARDEPLRRLDRDEDYGWMDHDPVSDGQWEIPLLGWRGDHGTMGVDDRITGVRKAPRTSRYWKTTFPIFPLVVLFGLVPLTWVIGSTRAWSSARRRTRAGLCPTCGYDLRATPDRCPECGQATNAVEA